MINRLKFLYSPGLFSLLGILGFILVNYRKVLPKQENVITYFAPKDEKPNNQFSKIFSRYTILDDFTMKKKILITFDSDYVTNSKKLNVIRYEAQKLKYTNDFSSAILITLSNTITYGEFVSLLNICIMDKHKRFAAFDDKFVIFGPEDPKILNRKIKLLNEHILHL